MILQSLVRCYDSLAAQGKLERPGWSVVKVQWGLYLTADGQVESVEMLGTANEKGKLIPRTMFLPTPAKRTSGHKAASFLCDNAKYLLGITNEPYSGTGKDPLKDAEICFRTSAKKHHALLDGISCPMAQAILRFFDTWQPEQAMQFPALSDHFDELCKSSNLVFCMTDAFGVTTMSQDIPEIQAVWDEAANSSTEDNITRGRCLVTGELDTIARLHPAIKGITGAQPSGALLVSFNNNSFESYGREEAQGLNAPIGNRAAFAYGEALNYMLRVKDYHSLLGSTTLVYWAETAQSAYSDCFAAMLGTNNDMTQNMLDGIMKAIRLGQDIQWKNVPLNSSVPFYILGLTPNTSRLSVRFFLQGTFGDFAANLARHQERLNIIRPSYDTRETLSAYALLKETTRNSDDDDAAKNESAKKHMSKRKSENDGEKKSLTFSDILIRNLLCAILNNTPYPVALLTQTELRIHAEQKINRGKAAIIKAWLLKNGSNPQYKEVIDVQLNEQTNYAPYVLGRLFAVLESLQQKANPGINATIMDRYFNAACATPSIVFPTLLKLAQSHLKKLDTGYFIYYDKQMTELCGRLTDSYPARLNLQDQGIFQLGYYHQKQKFFTKKEENSNV
jgi:CRISPR-associated protein, csd1 family